MLSERRDLTMQASISSSKWISVKYIGVVVGLNCVKITQMCVVVDISGSTVQIATLCPNDPSAVMDCILPIAEFEKQTLEKIATQMKDCHVVVEHLCGRKSNNTLNPNKQFYQYIRVST